jgi:hypothetical protein
MSLHRIIKKLGPEERKYIASERFIHDDLLKRAEQLVNIAHGVWRDRKDPSIVVFWPGEAVTDDEGDPLEGEIFGAFPKTDTKTALKKLADKTKAYGLLIIELRPDALYACFESHHGARSWTAKIERRGDRHVLGTTLERTDEDHIGLLWSPVSGTA